MNWSKIPTNLLTQRIPDNELVAIVKYQLLWASLEEQPDAKIMQRYLTSKQIELATSWQDSIRELVTSDLRLVNGKRKSNKILYKKNNGLKKIQDTCQDTIQDTCLQEVDKIRLDKKRKEINKEKKLTQEEIKDWDTLFTYWEQNKKGSKYKNDESRQRQLKKLKELTSNNFDYARRTIFHCIDNGYHGFTNGKDLYYKEVITNDKYWL